MSEKFWKPKPTEPMRDLAMYSLAIPIFISAFGFFIVGVFAFSFDAIQEIPASVQNWLTIAGSALVVFGAELNTPGTFVAVFRKWQKDKSANIFDWLAVGLSGVGTLANLLVVFALLILSSDKFTGNAGWLSVVMNFGPLVAAFAVACDYYGSLIELGFLFGAYELRYEKWLDEKRAFELQEEQKPFTGRDEQFAELRQEFTELAQRLNALPKPHPRKQDFENWLAELNGDGAKLKTVDDVMQAMSAVGWSPEKRDIVRWFEVEK